MLLTLLLACNTTTPDTPTDADGDGYSVTDCDDTSPAAFPGGTEVCDGLDNDCNGEIDEQGGLTLHADADGDGYGDPALAATLCEPGDGWVGNFDDCDDTSADNHPGADEICDEIDNNCDGLIDDADEGLTIGDWSFDSDGDGYGGDLKVERCSYEKGYVLEGGDCDDKDVTLSPGVAEVCDGIDNDCDGLIDADDDAVDAQWWYTDDDDDGYGAAESGVFSCTDLTDRITAGGDCDDTDSAISPGLSETIGNGIDDNCNDLQDERLIIDAVLSWSGTFTDNAAGSSVAGVGDVNGDGYDDILIGEPGNDAEGEDAGASFLILGGPFASISTELSQADARIYGEQYGDSSGAAVAGAGDVNNDGYDDILIGAPTRGVDAGAVYLLLGPITGTLELDEADYEMTAEGTEYRAGAALSPVGDVDGDGRADFAVGAPGVVDAAGRAYLILGGDLFSGSLSGAEARVSGRSEEGLGSAVGGGDFNGDGLADLLLGASRSDEGGYISGSAHVFFGDTLNPGMSITEDDATVEGESTLDLMGTAVSGSGDINGDGYADIVAGAPDDDNGNVNGGGLMLVYGSSNLSGNLTEDARLLGGFYTEGAGTSVEILPDTNGNSRDELLIGAPGNTVSGEDAGATYLVYGGGLTGTFTLAERGEIVVGAAAGDRAGTSVSGAGDFDGDGRDDLLIGAPGASGTWSGSGAAWLISGDALR
ncbi:MAG: hypothetical protein ACI8RZ_002051 [Myxococcota bacterium]|jgi:hypothetical protein